MDSNSEAIKHEHCLFTRLCPLLVIRLLPLRVFDDLKSPLVYGEIPHNSTVRGMFLIIFSLVIGLSMMILQVDGFKICLKKKVWIIHSSERMHGAVYRCSSL